MKYAIINDINTRKYIVGFTNNKDIPLNSNCYLVELIETNDLWLQIDTNELDHFVKIT